MPPSVKGGFLIIQRKAKKIMEKMPSSMREHGEFEKKYGLDNLHGDPSMSKTKEQMSIAELDEYVYQRKKQATSELVGEKIFGMKLKVVKDKQSKKPGGYCYDRLTAYISKEAKTTYIRLDGCYTLEDAKSLLREKIESNEKHKWILEKFGTGCFLLCIPYFTTNHTIWYSWVELVNFIF